MIMNDIITRNALIHHYPGYELEKFLNDIDKTGGWPVGYEYVSFYHSVENRHRMCKFGNQELREPYWTTVCSADDYYWWKISSKKKEKIIKTAYDQLIRQILSTAKDKVIMSFKEGRG